MLTSGFDLVLSTNIVITIVITIRVKQGLIGSLISPCFLFHLHSTLPFLFRMDLWYILLAYKDYDLNF